MNYLSEMHEATLRAARLGLETPCFKPQEGRLLNEQVVQEILHVVSDAVGELPVEAIAGQCLSYHMLILPALSNYFDTELTYTIGHVSIDEETLFRQTEEQMKSLIQDGISREPLNKAAQTSEFINFKNQL